MHQDISTAALNEAIERSWQAFEVYQTFDAKRRASFMHRIATELEQNSASLLKTAMEETHLTEPRLRSELTRTIFQLKSYADFAVSGQGLEASIDTGNKSRNPPKPDLRKMLFPIGPVAVFGAANFPFAYSTAGGDTACAFAAGCPVIVKAHPGHPATSALTAECVTKAVAYCGMPDGLFTHIFGASSQVGEQLVKHPKVKAVGFTGSFTGGKQLFDWGQQREEPIPVFAEMSSVNPVFILPARLASGMSEIAIALADSISLSAGQFCTSPGIIIATESAPLQAFITLLKEKLLSVAPAPMLNRGIYDNFREKLRVALEQPMVDAVLDQNKDAGDDLNMVPVLSETNAANFINNPRLQQEVFGSYAMVVRCKDLAEMKAVARKLKGQLTASIMATDEELAGNELLLADIRQTCGRMIFNGVPTGVEVCLSMQHGGPFPATTDARFTSVGAAGIKRFARPVCFQNCPDQYLPEALKNKNSLGIWRTVDNLLTKDDIDG